MMPSFGVCERLRKERDENGDKGHEEMSKFKRPEKHLGGREAAEQTQTRTNERERERNDGEMK